MVYREKHKRKLGIHDVDSTASPTARRSLSGEYDVATFRQLNHNLKDFNMRYTVDGIIWIRGKPYKTDYKLTDNIPETIKEIAEYIADYKEVDIAGKKRVEKLKEIYYQLSSGIKIKNQPKDKSLEKLITSAIIVLSTVSIFLFISKPNINGNIIAITSQVANLILPLGLIGIITPAAFKRHKKINHK